jgi:transposase
MTNVDPRVERGRVIAASKKLRDIGDGKWLVLSQTKPRTRYTVNAGVQTCTCPDYETWELPCKHVYAVKFFQIPTELEVVHEQEVPVVPRPQYQQNWPAYNRAQIHEKEYFQLLLQGLCDDLEEPKQSRGRPRIPLADAVYSAVMKVYTMQSGRRASTDIRDCLAKGFVEHAPAHNSISRILGQESLTAILKQMIEISAAPLRALESDFAIDGTGFSTSTYDRWFDHKYGKETGRKQRWIKCHALIGTLTNVVTSVEVTDGHVADTTQLPDLVARTARTFDMARLSADKAYLSITNLSAIGKNGTQPFIPFKSNSTGAGSVGVWKKMWHLFWFKRDEFLANYHRRSNVESTFSAIKRKFGGSVRSKDFVAQTNEVLCKVLAYNLTVLIQEMHERGIDPDLWTGPKVALQ